jgi:hypothetical protein
MLPHSIDLEIPLHATSYAGMDRHEDGDADKQVQGEPEQEIGAGKDRAELRM